MEGPFRGARDKKSPATLGSFLGPRILENSNMNGVSSSVAVVGLTWDTSTCAELRTRYETRVAL